MTSTPQPVSQPQSDLSAAIPDTFYGGVIKYLERQTDAPRGFLYGAVLMTTAAVIGNKVKIRVGRDEIRPNLYMIFLAGSSINRKTTGVMFTKKTLQELERHLTVEFLMPESGSLEGVIEVMREPRTGETKVVMNTGIACYSEFSSFLDNIRKDYNSGYESFILDVYDGNDHKRKLKKEDSSIKSPCLSILGGITMAQFKQRIRETDKHSGFLQRFLFCYEPDRSRTLKSMVQRDDPEPDEEKLFYDNLIEIYRTAEAIRATGKSFHLSPEAVAEYQLSFEADMAEIHRIKTTNSDLGEMLFGYLSRLDVVKFKIAMIYEVVKMAAHGVDPAHNDLVISAESMQEAIAAVTYFWEAIKHLLSSEFEFSPYAQKRQKIEGILRKAGGRMTNRDLLKKSNMIATEYKAVLSTAVYAGIMVEEEEKQGSGQTKHFVRLV